MQGYLPTADLSKVDEDFGFLQYGSRYCSICQRCTPWDGIGQCYTCLDAALQTTRRLSSANGRPLPILRPTFYEEGRRSAYEELRNWALFAGTPGRTSYPGRPKVFFIRLQAPVQKRPTPKLEQDFLSLVGAEADKERGGGREEIVIDVMSLPPAGEDEVGENMMPSPDTVLSIGRQDLARQKQRNVRSIITGGPVGVGLVPSTKLGAEGDSQLRRVLRMQSMMMSPAKPLPSEPHQPLKTPSSSPCPAKPLQRSPLLPRNTTFPSRQGNAADSVSPLWERRKVSRPTTLQLGAVLFD